LTKSITDTLVDRDRLVNADRAAVARMCVYLFDRIQAHPRKEEQLLALAACFLLMADACGVDAQEAFTAVKNLMADPLKEDGLVHQFAAMRYHLKTDVLL
jgi:hypothetical protein